MRVLQKFKAQDKLKNLQRSFSQRKCVLLVANKVKLSTRTMVLSIFLKSNKHSKFKKKHIFRSRNSEKKFREILWYFSSDIKAIKIAKFTIISEKQSTK